jgi:YesN/AraC family two-component response regulator
VKIYIKYMVSARCKMIVKSELKKLGLHYGSVDLGVAEILDNITTTQQIQLKAALLNSGLELLDIRKSILVERIKSVVVELVHHSERVPKINFSVYLSRMLQYDYTYLANVFSEVTGTTIEHYLIANKIERVKELLLSDKLNLTQISKMLNYSSVAHLSNQFKKVTGLTTSSFKHVNLRKVTNLQEV